MGRLFGSEGQDVFVLRHKGGAVARGRGRQQAGRAPQPDPPLPRSHPAQGGATRGHQAPSAAEAKLQPATQELAANGPGQVRGGVEVKVSDLPPGRLLSVEPGTAIAEVARQMQSNDSDSVAVISDGRLVGIITE